MKTKLDAHTGSYYYFEFLLNENNNDINTIFNYFNLVWLENENKNNKFTRVTEQ